MKKLIALSFLFLAACGSNSDKAAELIENGSQEESMVFNILENNSCSKYPQQLVFDKQYNGRTLYENDHNFEFVYLPDLERYIIYMFVEKPWGLEQINSEIVTFRDNILTIKIGCSYKLVEWRQ